MAIDIDAMGVGIDDDIWDNLSDVIPTAEEAAEAAGEEQQDESAFEPPQKEAQPTDEDAWLLQLGRATLAYAKSNAIHNRNCDKLSSLLDEFAKQFRESDSDVAEPVATTGAAPSDDDTEITWTQPAMEEESGESPAPWQYITLTEMGVPAGMCAALAKIGILTLLDLDRNQRDLTTLPMWGKKKVEKLNDIRMAYIADHGDD